MKTIGISFPSPNQVSEDHAVELLEQVNLRNFQATPQALQPFQSSILSWQVEAPNGVLIKLNGSTVAKSGTLSIQPTATQTFHLYAQVGRFSRFLGTVTNDIAPTAIDVDVNRGSIIPRSSCFVYLAGFALTMIAACDDGTKAVGNSRQALIAAPSVCSPLTTPYDACVVADASGHVDRAGLQSLIDQASAQYALRPASLGPIRVTLPGELSYTLDGTLKVKTGVHLVGTGAVKPRLVSVGPTIDVAAWVQAARLRAETFVPPESNPPYEFVREPINHIRCASPWCPLADLELGLADLDAWLAPTYVLLCPDDDCTGTQYRYFDILHDATLALDNETHQAYLFSYHAGWVDVLVPGYEHAGLPDQYDDPERVTADPVISIPEFPPAAAGRLQTVLENVAIECAPGPYIVVARGTLPGNRAIGVMIGGGTGHTVEDVVVRGNEIIGCAIGIQSVNTHHAQIVDNDVVMGLHAAPITPLVLDADWPTYERNLALDLPSANRGEGYNGIRIHGTLDRGIRVENNRIGRNLPWVPDQGPIRGIHVHGSNPSSREDFVIINNTIWHAQENGIDVEGDARDIIVTGNRVESMGRVFSPSKASYAISFRCQLDRCESGFHPDRFSHAGNTLLAGSVFEWCNQLEGPDTCNRSPEIAQCTGCTLQLDHYPLGQPPGNRVVVGRTVTFAPPAPSFADGCSAAIAPQYALCSGPTTANCTLIVDFPHNGPITWTPQTTGARTFRLGARSRDAAPGDPWLAQTEAVTINVVAPWSSTLGCTSPELSIVSGPVAGTVQIAPATTVSCTSFTVLEYQLRARRIGSLFWSTTFGYSPSDTFIWNPATVDGDAVEFQIRYRRQGSNASYERTTQTLTYP